MKLTKKFDNLEKLVNLYESIYSALPVGIAVFDETGQCYFATKKIVNLIGANSIDDVLSQNYHHVDSWKKSGLYDVALKSLKQKKSLKFSFHIKTTFQKDIWTEIICTSVEKESGSHLVILVTDITEFKLNEIDLKSKIFYDSLTGIYNRRFFDDMIETEIQRCTRSGKPLSLILLDIDFFKDFNDYYGHVAGDETLKKVAATIRSSLNRKSDFVARYGGEEFVCILPYTDTDGAWRIAKKIQTNTEALRISHIKSDVSSYLTISQGLVSHDPQNPTTKKQLVYSADTALYYAKQHGRNRVERFNPETC